VLTGESTEEFGRVGGERLEKRRRECFLGRRAREGCPDRGASIGELEPGISKAGIVFRGETGLGGMLLVSGR